MSKTRDTGFLGNVVKVDSNGDISLMHGSTMLMQISSSGAVTTTGVISGSNALTSSYSQNSELLDNLDSTSFVFTSSYNTDSSSFSTRTTNLETASGSFSTRVTRIEGNYATTGSNVFLGAQTVCANITSTGTIIAQTLNVQQVTSSVVYSSGSNVFGCSLSNTQQFTGSMLVTGSTAIFSVGCTGFGVTSPTVRLQASGTIAVGTDATGWGRLSFDNATNTTRLQSAKNGTESVGLSFWTQASGGGFAERMVVSGSNVGIGTCTPSEQLHLYNTGTSPRPALFIETCNTVATPEVRLFQTSGRSILMNLQTNGDWSFQNSANNSSYTERLRITSAGLVGLNTTSPSAELQVNKNCDAVIAISNCVNVTSGNRGSLAFYNCAVSTVALIRAAAVTDNVGTELQFHTRPAGGSLTQVLTLGNTGIACFRCQVCIGGNLVVNGGNIDVNCDTTAATDARINFYTKNAVNGDRISIYGYNLAATTANCEITYEGLGYCCTNNQGYINFQTKSGGAWCNTMYLINGRVGIGTATPCSKLHVAGGGIVIDNNQDYRSLNSSGVGRTILYLDSYPLLCFI